MHYSAMLSHAMLSSAMHSQAGSMHLKAMRFFVVLSRSYTPKPYPLMPCVPIQALILDPRNLKALVRRAAAQLELGQAKEAMQVQLVISSFPRPCRILPARSKLHTA